MVSRVGKSPRAESGLSPGPARAIIRFRFPLVIGWIVVAGFAVPRAARVGEVLTVGGRSARPTETQEARAMIRRSLPRPIAKFMAVTVTGPVPVDSAPFRSLIEALSVAAIGEPYIDRVFSYLTAGESDFVSAGRHATFLLASIDAAHADTATRTVPAFRAAIRRAASIHASSTEYEIHVTGEPALEWDILTLSAEDARRGELRALVPAAVVLLLAFGAVAAALLPLIVSVLAIACALAAVHVAALFLPMSVFVLPIVTMIGLGVGIDYSLLVITRFREEVKRGLEAPEAAVRTLGTAGRAVVISGGTVLIGFASLLLTPATETRSVGIGGLLVVTAAVLLATTLLPPVLVFLGPRIDWPRWLARRLTWYHAPGLWARWGGFLGRRKWPAMAVGLVLMAIVTWPVVHLNIGVPRQGWFPRGTESMLGAETMGTIRSRGSLLPIRVVIQAPVGERIVGTRYLSHLKRFSDSLRADPRVADVLSPVDVSPGTSLLEYAFLYGDLARARERSPEFLEAYLSEDGRTALMDVIPADTTSPSGAAGIVRAVRALAAAGPRGLGGAGVVIKVGGFAAAGVDEEQHLVEAFPVVIGLVLAVTAIALGLAFRSVLVPIKAVFMNGLSVAGAFGLIVLVFQRGFGSAIFGLAGPAEATLMVVLVLVFCVAFGLSMDYEVFLLSRIKEVFDRTQDNERATMEGVGASASVITSAAAIMVIVFGAFAFSRVMIVQLLGFGLAVAVLLDVTLIRMVLVPAFMHIAGRWNWWPGVRGKRLTEMGSR